MWITLTTTSHLDIMWPTGTKIPTHTHMNFLCSAQYSPVYYLPKDKDHMERRGFTNKKKIVLIFRNWYRLKEALGSLS